jgi:hypothetical protein
MRGTWARWVALGVVVFGCDAVCEAFYLDDGRNFDVRLRAYSQLGIMAEDAAQQGCEPFTATVNGKKVFIPGGNPAICPPQYSLGDLGQERNFYNPEFDAKLTQYMRWTNDVPGMGWFTPDDLKFRFAWWGFYDGLYDYLNPVWDQNRRDPSQQFRPAKFGIARFSQTDDVQQSYFFRDQNKNPRDFYAKGNRINELYLDYTKGPLFVRVGRQAISWGESDTVALLDVQNPFDLLLAAPGFFQDVDEARIPLWTLRTTYKLFSSWKFISSAFLDAYMVPGPIDTTIPNDPITYGVSPFNPDVPNPQGNIYLQGQEGLLHTVVVDKQPEETWANTRWGARLQGLLFRDYTVQGWFFRTFNQQPAPLLSSVSAFTLSQNPAKISLVDDRGFLTPICLDDNGNRLPRKTPNPNYNPNQPGSRPFLSNAGAPGHTPAGRPCSWQAPVVTTLNRRLESVIGLAGSWYSEPLNGIVRTEAEYFIDELAFIPGDNLNPRAQIPAALRPNLGYKKHILNTIPTANFLRWVVAYDRFFFFRPLNPTNSFTLSMAFNSSYNLSEDGSHDFRYPNAKPGKSQTQNVVTGLGTTCVKGAKAKNNPLCVTAVPTNFEDLYKYEGFVTTTLQTDYLHGALEPRITIITDVSGIFAFQPTATYRVTDNFLLGATYLAIASHRKAGLATFRAHDMFQLRATVQLN